MNAGNPSIRDLIRLWQERYLPHGRQFTPNRMEIDGPALRIYLAGGRVATTDAKFYETLRHFRWHFVYRAKPGDGGYVRATIGSRSYRVALHSMVLFLSGVREWEEIDHRDRDTLNNRRSNLRPCTHAQNMQNRETRPGLKGVDRCGDRWRAKFRAQYLGMFGSPEEAARAYDTAARHHAGEFACLNFPEVV